MSKLLFVFALTLITGLLALSVGDQVSAQDCERAIPGNTQSPCKQLDYLDGIQPPIFVVEQVTDDRGEYACQGSLEFKSNTPLQDHFGIAIAGSLNYSVTTENKDSFSWNLSPSWLSGYNEQNFAYSDYYYLTGSRFWRGSGYTAEASGDRVRAEMGPETYLESSVGESPYIFPYLLVAAQFGEPTETGRYGIVSNIFQPPEEVADYQLLMNQCLAGITLKLEHDASVEAARQQGQEDKVRAETAAEEAENQAELAAIELKSAEDALRAAEELNVALLQETIISIKREDAIRAAWQQVILVRMAGLEERTKIWNEAVTRWFEEDLQFSSAMEARIQEVERLQSLNAALEQSMADQRRILIARLEELEKAEQEALERREPGN